MFASKEHRISKLSIFCYSAVNTCLHGYNGWDQFLCDWKTSMDSWSQTQNFPKGLFFLLVCQLTQRHSKINLYTLFSERNIHITSLICVSAFGHLTLLWMSCWALPSQKKIQFAVRIYQDDKSAATFSSLYAACFLNSIIAAVKGAIAGCQ